MKLASTTCVSLLVLFLLVELFGDTALAAQGGTSTCNDMSRHLTTSAGVTDTGTQACPNFTFTVQIQHPSGGPALEVGFQFPTVCAIGRREQDKDCFDCGPAAVGNHCVGQGFTAKVKIYSIGGGNPCPTIPDSLPTTLREAGDLVHCKELPLLHTESVWCARVIQCGDGQLVPAYEHGELLVDSYGHQVRIWLTEPDELLAAPQADPIQEFLTDVHALPGPALPEVLATSVDAHRAVPGIADLHATVQLAFAGAEDQPPITNVYELYGQIAADGRYAIDSLLPSSSPEGAPEIAIEQVAFDGASLFYGTRGSPFYTAYSATSVLQPGARAVHDAYLEPLYAWASDPYRVLRFPGTQYLPESVGSEQRITETYPAVFAPGGTGRTIYTIETNGAVPHIVRMDVRNDDDQLVWRRDFGAFRTLAEGVWRPYRTADRFYEPGSTDPWLVKTLIVHEARMLAEGEFDETWQRPASEQGWWYVRP